jgi:hypothetical protein
MQINPAAPDLRIRQIQRKRLQVEAGFRRIARVAGHAMLLEEGGKLPAQVGRLGPCDTCDRQQRQQEGERS